MKHLRVVAAIGLLALCVVACGQSESGAAAGSAVQPAATAPPIPGAASPSAATSPWLPTATEPLPQVPATSAAPPAPPATPAPSRTPPGLAAQIDSYLERLAQAKSFAGAVLVARDGQVILSKGYGWADRERNLSNTPQTKFRLCSITKQFTAMGILILQHQGRLSVDTLLCDLLPECPAAWQAITVHHLLVHTSGIPDFVELPDYERTKGLPSSPLETIARFRDLPLQFDPGDRWRYSNSGYVILGYIIEQVSGRPYDAFMQENIFGPLQMDDSGYDHNLDTIATGYKGAGSRWVKAEAIDMSIPYAAGALYSTVEDLYRWDQALYTEHLIPKSLMAEMLAPHVGSPIGNFGYGWIVTDKHGRGVVRHGGGGDGFATLIERYPDDRVMLVVLSNRESTEIGMIADAIGMMIFGE